MGGTVLPCEDLPDFIGFVWFTHIEGEEVCSNPLMSRALCSPEELEDKFNTDIAFGLNEVSEHNARGPE